MKALHSHAVFQKLLSLSRVVSIPGPTEANYIIMSKDMYANNGEAIDSDNIYNYIIRMI